MSNAAPTHGEALFPGARPIWRPVGVPTKLLVLLLCLSQSATLHHRLCSPSPVFWRSILLITHSEMGEYLENMAETILHKVKDGLEPVVSYCQAFCSSVVGFL